VHALIISLFILTRFYGWFAIADRFAIFLYNHLGATPFDQVTRSRYWMAGLVAAGEVMIVYVLSNWIAGQIASTRGREYHPPLWWMVWILGAPWVFIGILIVTMTANSPTLPLPNALASAAAALSGMAFALMTGAWAARQPGELIWLACDGAGLMPVLLLFRVIEFPSRQLSLPFALDMAYPFAIGTVAAGITWLVIMTGLRFWRRRSAPNTIVLLGAGLALSYLLMPVVHHWLATPPDWRYISTSSNFFALSPLVQAATFLVTAAMASGITCLRSILNKRARQPNFT
jgi:hypothetical protein